jgi:hypothetical protein
MEATEELGLREEQLELEAGRMVVLGNLDITDKDGPSRSMDKDQISLSMGKDHRDKTSGSKDKDKTSTDSIMSKSMNQYLV